MKGPAYLTKFIEKCLPFILQSVTVQKFTPNHADSGFFAVTPDEIRTEDIHLRPSGRIFLLITAEAETKRRKFKMNEWFQKIAENAMYVLSFLLIIVVLFMAAVLLEKAAQKKNGVDESIFNTRKIAMIGMFSAVAMLLHLFDFSLPFAPPFYKLDFSELPILVGTFAFGPAAGVMMEFIKILLKLCIKGTSTAFVGDLANFVIGCSFILPASVMYAFRKNKKMAIIACITGTLVMTVFGTAFNAVYLLPAFSKLYGMPLESLLAMGSEVNPLAKDGNIVSFVVACVAPLNLIKGASVSVVTLLIYKPLSPIIKTGHGMYTRDRKHLPN